jgi:hypothetical protein
MAKPSERCTGLLVASSVPAAATALAFALEFFFDPSTGGSWAAMTVAAAPLVSYVMNRRRPVATSLSRALLVGLPQVPVYVVLVLAALVAAAARFGTSQRKKQVADTWARRVR